MKLKSSSAPVEQQTEQERQGPLGAVQQIGRVASFWSRGGIVYLSYKVAQARAAVLRRSFGWDAEKLREEFWAPHHTWAGDTFYSMAVDLRGFYLKIGQFFAARAEWVPEPICKKLSLLHDEVPPMSGDKARKVIEQELHGALIQDIFEWIDLDSVLGSASIAQVHKAKLRSFRQKRILKRLLNECLLSQECTESEEGPVHDIRRLWGSGQQTNASRCQDYSNLTAEPLDPVEAARRAAEDPHGPTAGIVAVKVQYPDALPVMMGDLKQIRRFSRILQKLEINFDLVSAVDELADQVKLEFDFIREAKIMDAIAHDLRDLKHVEIPRSVPGLVTRRLLVMRFVEGEQISRLKDRVRGMSAGKQRLARQRILHRVADAYGHMLLGTGLFQADPHAGNILVMQGAKIGLLDYGQSKQLSPAAQLGFAELVIEMSKGIQKADPLTLSRRLRDMGLEFTNDENHRIEAMMAFGMFDTELSHRVDPFSAHSPIKKLGITRFPPEVFFVLRALQMLRGLAMGMQQPDFSAAKRWRKMAKEKVKHHKL